MKSTLAQLQSRLEGNADLSGDDREELLGLLDELRQQSDEWDETEEIKAALAEAAAPGDSPPSFQDRLLALEAEHPLASTLIGRLANMLSRMGI